MKDAYVETMIVRAVNFAKKKHGDQKYNGKPYLYHPLQTSKILTQITDDANLIVAGILHDTLEDTDTTYEELAEEFNEDIANLVKEVTKTAWNVFPNLKTTRGVILKFADRLSNLSNMDVWSGKSRKKYIKKSKFWKSR